jgi:ferredoxin
MVTPTATTTQVTLTINGQAVTVEKGTLLIEAAKQAGVDVPHFCYHPKLKPDANCRMCLVEIEKAPKLQTSCNMPVAEGMVVSTNSPKVAEARAGVLEFILANHPLDCPICDKGGECHLQDEAHAYTPNYSRFEEPKRFFEKEYFGPLIDKEMTRCVQCLRCVRYCDEIVDSRALGSRDRGSLLQIGGLVNKELDCEFCGGCIQICPVGALTSRVAMYDYRPWQLKKIETICPHCADGCRLKVESRDNVALPDASDAGRGRNAGDLCAKGYFGFDVINRDDRLKKPLVRKARTLVETSWFEATALVAERFAASRRSTAGARSAGSSRRRPPTKTCTCSRSSCGSSWAAPRRQHGALWPPQHDRGAARRGRARPDDRLLRGHRAGGGDRRHRRRPGRDQPHRRLPRQARDAQPRRRARHGRPLRRQPRFVREQPRQPGDARAHRPRAGGPPSWASSRPWWSRAASIRRSPPRRRRMPGG